MPTLRIAAVRHESRTIVARALGDLRKSSELWIRIQDERHEAAHLPFSLPSDEAMTKAVGQIGVECSGTKPSMKNSIFVIKPCKWEGMWVFDDPNVGLVKEPFVGGADTIIDRAIDHIPNASQGFLAVFSAGYSPDVQIVLEWVREEGGGNVYRWQEK